MKFCPKCKQTKNFNDFAKNKTNADGLSTYCRECNSIIKKEIKSRNNPNNLNPRDWIGKNEVFPGTSLKIKKIISGTKTRATSCLVDCLCGNKDVAVRLHSIKIGACVSCSANCPFSKRKQSAKTAAENFIQKAQEIHKNKYLYTDTLYINSRGKINIECPMHGLFIQRASDHLSGNGCFKCRIDSTKLGLERLIDRMLLKHEGKYKYNNITDYYNVDTKITITCPKHGDFKQTPHVHLQGHGCPKCRIQSLPKTTEQFISDAIKVHGKDRYDYSKVIYTRNRSKIIVICHKHGDFKQTPNSHLKGRGCHKCSKNISKGESAWLDSLGIPDKIGITRQVKIKLNKIKTIIVDGYDPQTNTVYEYHGDYWHGNLKLYDPQEVNGFNKKTMLELFQETSRRSQLIRAAGYAIVSIWESEWKKQQSANNNQNIKAA